jgi:hypothetical protein
MNKETQTVIGVCVKQTLARQGGTLYTVLLIEGVKVVIPMAESEDVPNWVGHSGYFEGEMKDGPKGKYLLVTGDWWFNTPEPEYAEEDDDISAEFRKFGIIADTAMESYGENWLAVALEIYRRVK